MLSYFVFFVYCLPKDYICVRVVIKNELQSRLYRIMVIIHKSW